MIITHAQRITDAGEYEDVAIRIKNGMIAEIFPAASLAPVQQEESLDARGWIATPGWIDLQINGGFGMDFTTDPAFLWDVASRLPRFGVAGFLPTIITTSEETYRKAISIIKNGPPRGWRGARPFGWHFEGPFLNPAKKGAHNPVCLRQPNLAFVEDWSRENGVALVTMAPELPGAFEVSSALAARGVVVSVGHTAGSIADAQSALENGFTAATHLFNAMPPLEHRSPGLAGEVLLNDRFIVGVIADGLHIHPTMVELAWRLKGADKVVLITDAVGALGVQPGPYTQGGLEIVVDESSARLKDGTLAGSVLKLDQALRNVMQFTGSRLDQVLPALSRTQSRLLGLRQNGEIAPGFKADLTFIDPQGFVQMTVVGGEVVFQKSSLNSSP